MEIPARYEDHIDKLLAKRCHLDFMQYCWQKESPLIVGYHTKIICERIDKAIEDFKQGQSTFLMIKVPFRHGKSDMISRYLPPHFLGEFPEEEVIVAGYTSSLIGEFSKFGRKLLQDDTYQSLYPGTKLSKDEQSVDVWGLHKHQGKAYWVGLSGSITGKGGACIIVDDFFKGREDAESELMREKVWASFANDVMTRRAPVSIVIVLATPWHVDDLFGRIKKAMNEDPLFPEFEELKFPARSKQYREINGTDFLFPQRFDQNWYEGQYSTLSQYESAGLLDCDPVLREGNLFAVDRVKECTRLPTNIRTSRGWDLASSEKEKRKSDPDYTASIRMGVSWQLNDAGMKVPTIYIDDYTSDRLEALKRNKKIQKIAEEDGPGTQVGIEGYGIGKDAYTILRDVLNGIRTVHKIRLPGDKIARADVLAPVFEAGNVYMKKAHWNAALYKELQEFPGGVHDDAADALVTAFAVHKPFVKHVFPQMSTIETYRYQLRYQKMNPAVSFHYGALVQKKDLSIWFLSALWDGLAEKLFVHACEHFETPEIGHISRVLLNRMELNNHKVDKIICNELISPKNAELEKTVRKQLRNEFRKMGLRSLPVRDSVKKNTWGNITVVQALTIQEALYFHEDTEEALIQCQRWDVENNKPSEIDNGWCECLLLIVAELKKRNILQKKFRVRDYRRVSLYDRQQTERDEFI